MRSKITLTSYKQQEKVSVIHNYKDFKIIPQQALEVNVLLETKKDAEKLIEFLNNIKQDLV